MVKMRMIVFCILIALIIPSFSLAQEQKLNVSLPDAEYCLNLSNQYMHELSMDNFSIQRINDSLKIALEVFDAQKIQPKADYSFIISSCEDIFNVRKIAYEAKDLLYGLEKDYSSFVSKVARYKMDISSVDTMMNTIRQDFQSERYEEVKEEIPEIESKMTEIEASATTLNLFYTTSVTTFKSFIQANYIFLLSIIAILIVSFFLYRYELRRILIRRKIKGLELEKKVVKKLIQGTQMDYFHKGSIPEGTYRIRLNKFADLIRDIDRQIPLMQEELAKLERHKKTD